jgi:hypothetical protein
MEELYMKKIEDFGQKIGGARKDMYACATRGNLSEYSRSMLHDAKLKDAWPSITQKQEDDPFLRIWKQKMRGLLYKNPHFAPNASEEEERKAVEKYYSVVTAWRDTVMAVTDKDGIYAVYKLCDSFDSSQQLYDTFGVFKSDVASIMWSHHKLKRQAEKREERKASSGSAESKHRKKRFVPEQLAHLKRIGPDWRHGRNASEKDWLEGLGFRAGEFGNWLSQLDRRVNMDMAYDAFMDLAYILDVTPDSLSFGQLAIAFGSRGRGNAMAHYEPVAEVIALTKMKGAGSLAHETFHAIDDMIAKKNGRYGGLASEYRVAPVKELDDLKEIMRYQEGGRNRTDFYRGSLLFDHHFSKADKGYWSSACEMAARAFACYISDKLAEKGMRNDYLCGHSEAAAAAIPHGEERERINRAFDELFKALKAEGLLKPADSLSAEEMVSSDIDVASGKELMPAPKKVTPKAAAKKTAPAVKKAEEKKPGDELILHEEPGGQLSFLL